MDKIKVESLSDEEKKSLGVNSWPIWTKKISKFNWSYDETEVCYILEGKVIVTTSEGEKVEIKAGDYVTFPKGLSCVWDIVEPIKKHYSFRTSSDKI
ncbi:MAG: cupin domain-containing protein [Thermodesulfovibrionales bacterium]|nr:cupin domain-containing protein [Thermodesulfovibrionales bacterium]